MSTRIHKWCQTLLLCCAAIVSLGWAPGALAVDDLNLFELDANTVDSPAGMPDDWNNIHSGNSSSSATTGIVPDSIPRVFTGGSKDILDISGWSHRLGSSPPKSDLLHAYAAAYPSGQDLIIYFGADRASTNGTVTTGFWFFKNEISINANGSFSGLHSDGDVLVVADYDNGGKVGTIVVYEWLGGGLQKIIQSQNLLGSPGLFCDANDYVCATTNAGNIPVPWNGTLTPGQFFEGGINITQLIPGAGCFSSFMATSRSSTSETAEIKNFILKSFPVCGMTIGKACFGSPTFDADTNLVTTVFKSEIKNTGFGKIYDVTIQEDAIFGLTTDSASSQCVLTDGAGAANGTVLVDETHSATNKPPQVKVLDELAAGATATLTITCTSSRKKLINTIFVKGKTSSSSTVFNVPEASHTTLDTTSPPETCSALVPANVQVVKSCNKVTMVNGVTPNVCVDVTVTNLGSQDLKLTKLDDAEPGGVSGVDMLAALKTQNQINGDVVLQQSGTTGDSLSVKHCYTPQAGSSENPAIDHFDDTATVEGEGAFDQSFASDTSDPATCYLCPQP